MVLSAYGVYYLIGDFLHVLLVAYIAGIAYHQSKERFTSFLADPQTYEGKPRSFRSRLAKILTWLGVGFIFPRARYLLTHPHKINSFPTLGECMNSIEKTNNYAVIACEVLIGLYVFYLSFEKFIGKIGKRLVPTNSQFIRVLFAIMVLLLVVGLTIIIPTVFFKEVANIGHAI